MKKVLKASVGLILVLTMCMTLSGCSLIDDLKEARAYYGDSDSCIFYNDVTYRKVPDCAYFTPEVYGEGSDSINVADEEVPLLLSNIFGESYTISPDKKYLSGYSPGNDGAYYCSEDVYFYVMENIENGIIPDGYRYSYYDYIADDHDLYRNLTEAELKTIDKAYEEAEIVDPIDDPMRFKQRADIYAYVENLPIEVCRFSVVEDYWDNYYILEPEVPEGLTRAQKDEYIASDSFSNTIWRKVPAKYFEDFEAILYDADSYSWDSPNTWK